MDERKIFNQLRQDIEIPEIVRDKANIALGQIINEQKSSLSVPTLSKKRKKRNYTKISIAIFAATMLLGTLTVCAEIYKKWSQGVEEELHIEETDKIVAESIELVQFQNIVKEDAGIKITAQQSLVDNYTAFLSFKVEGFDIEKYDEPDFGEVTVNIEGETVNVFHDFYDNLIAGDDGRVIMSDGSEIPRDENGSLMISYLMDDGSLEYRILIMDFKGAKGNLLNKNIQIKFEDLGVSKQKGGFPEIQVEGIWEFEWELHGCGDTYEKETSIELGDTGATVKYIEISPISLKVVYDYKRETVWTTTMVGNEEYKVPNYNEPPILLGVKLKDGTLLPYINMGGGLQGFINDYEYTICFMTDRILNVDEIEALLFKNDETYDYMVDQTEDMFHVVNIR